MDPDSDIDSSESNMKSCSSDSDLNTATDSSKSMLASSVSENEKWSSNSESCASTIDTDDLSDSHEEMNIDEQVAENDYNFSFFEKLLGVFSFTVKHNLPYTAVDELLFKGENSQDKELESVYQLRRYMDRNMLRPKIYYLCPSSYCHGSYPEEDVPKRCSHKNCNEPLGIEELRKKGQYFLYTPLAAQMKKVLEIVEMEQILSDYLDGTVLKGMECYPNSLKNIFSSKRSVLKSAT